MLIRSIITLALCACATDALAESVWIGGGSLSGQTRVGYGGVVVPLPGKRLGDGWSQSLFASGVRYRYGAAGRDVEGIATGLKYGVMRQFQAAGGSIGVGGGVTWQHTSLTPDDLDNPTRGGRVRGVAEFQWQSASSAPWRTQAFAQQVFGARSNYLVGFVGRHLASGAALGPQVSTSGDPNYRVYGAAVALNAIKLGAMEAGVYLGAQHLEGGDTRPEAGFSVVIYRP